MPKSATTRLWTRLNMNPMPCIFNRGYFDLARLFRIHLSGAFFVIRDKVKAKIEIVDGEDMLDEEDSVLLD